MDTHAHVGFRPVTQGNTLSGTPSDAPKARCAGRSGLWNPLTLTLIVALGALLTWAAALSYYGSFYRGWDAQLYYAHLRSAVMDGDLDATNEIQQLTPGKAVFVSGAPWGGLPTTDDGQLVNVYTVGSSLMGLPGFMIGHIGAIITGQPTDGYSRPYEFAVTLWYALLVVLGCGVLGSALGRWTSARAAWLAVAAIFFGTNLIYYTGILPTMNHAPSFALMCVMLWLALRLYETPDRTRLWLASAVATFLLVLVRPTDVVMLVVLFPAAWQVIRTGWRPALRNGLPVAAAVVGAAVVQILVWRMVFGRWVANAYTEWTGGKGFNFADPKLPEILTSGRGGGWLYHPLYAAAFIGLIAGCVMVRGRQRAVWIAVTAGIVLHIGLYSCWVSWDSGESFGNRIFINSAPLGAMGLAWLIHQTRRPLTFRLAAGAVALAVAWNGLLMAGYIEKTLPHRDEINAAVLCKTQIQTVQRLLP